MQIFAQRDGVVLKPTPIVLFPFSSFRCRAAPTYYNAADFSFARTRNCDRIQPLIN